MQATPLLARHEAAGARLTEEAGWRMPADFGDPAAEHLACRDGAILIDLSHRGKLRIHGPDAAAFLHGMLSNRVEDLAPGEGVYAAFLTRQGKFVSDLCLYRTGEDFLASLPPGQAEGFAEALDHFIIMDQVETEDLTAARACLGLFGPRAREALAACGLPAPPGGGHAHARAGEVHIARELWTGEDGYLLTVPAGEGAALWDRLAGAGAAPAGLAAFGSLTLEAGVPLFGQDMDASVNPMQAGLEERAIDFEKGCYIGQEVIAKIKYLGQVNRGLVGLRLEGDGVPPPGAKVIGAGGGEAGAVTRSAYGPSVGRVVAFAYLRREAMAPGTAVRVRTGGAEAAGEVAELPFFRRPATAAQAHS